MYYELTPAYGKNYQTKGEVVAAFLAGKDFIGDHQLGFRYCSRQDLPVGCTVILRYRQNRLMTSLKLEAQS